MVAMASQRKHLLWSPRQQPRPLERIAAARWLTARIGRSHGGMRPQTGLLSVLLAPEGAADYELIPSDGPSSAAVVEDGEAVGCTPNPEIGQEQRGLEVFLQGW